MNPIAEAATTAAVPVKIVIRLAEDHPASVAALEAWLDRDESKAVGQKQDGDGESTGHAMGRGIVHILGKKEADDTDDDLATMTKVVGYVGRHSAQRPDGDVTETPWRRSLMNWGHDPSS